MKKFAKSILNYFATYTETRFNFRKKIDYKWTDDSLTSDLSVFTQAFSVSDKSSKKRSRKIKLIKNFNRIWDSKLILNKVVFNSLTWSLKSNAVCSAFAPAMRSLTAAGAVCLNTVVIPYLTQKGNVTFVDMGGIMWGSISRKNMIIGLPNNLYNKVEKQLIF